MNLAILLKVLQSLAPVTDLQTGSQALALKQNIELLARDPANAAQLNQLITQSVCQDWETFNQIPIFVAAVLTQGNPANVPQAIHQFETVCKHHVTPNGMIF